MTSQPIPRVLIDFQELERFAADWHRLHTVYGRPEIFQHFEWIRAWWKSFGAGYRLHTPVLIEGGRLVAALPLVLKGRCLYYLGHSVADYCHFLRDPIAGDRALDLCLDALLEQGTWNEIQLSNVPETSELATSIANLPRQWQRWITRTAGEPCPALLLGEDKEQALAALLSKDRLKRTVKYLGRRGPQRFRHIEDAAEFERHFPEFIRQHVRRSAIAGRRSAFLDEAYVQFYRDLVARFGLGAEIRFSVLEVGGRPVAYHFGTEFSGKYLFYKPTFDVDFWDLSPGQALLWHLFDYCRSVTLNEFDFGQGGESYKFRFSNDVRHNVNFTLYAPGPGSLARRACRRAAERAKARVRNSASLAETVTAIRHVGRKSALTFRRTGLLSALRTALRSVGDPGRRCCLLSVASAARAPDSTVPPLREATLASLADEAVISPEYLCESLLQEARRRLSQGQKALLPAEHATGGAILWVCLATEVRWGGETMALEKETWVVSGIWPLTNVLSRRDIVPLVEALKATLDDRDRSLVLLCPIGLLPTPQALDRGGISKLDSLGMGGVESQTRRRRPG